LPPPAAPPTASLSCPGCKEVCFLSFRCLFHSTSVFPPASAALPVLHS
jgi:hypothetical protein